jgi:NADPH2:quinone reductase
MRAVRYHEHGRRDVLGIDEIERPEPDGSEVLVEVEAAAVNPVDTYFREGSYRPGGLPWIPGSDVAGRVAAVGADVEAYEVGDRVFGTGLGRVHPGTCAEYVAVPVDFLAALPADVTFGQGAAVALVGVTAWQSLIEACDLGPAERVLVHGGSGGVGHVAVQIAAAAGARVTTTASPKYHDRVEDLGAETVLDYNRADLTTAIADAGAPEVILDHRLDDYLPADTEVAAHGGTIAAIGNDAPDATFESVPRCRGKALTVRHVSMFNVPDFGVILGRLARLMTDGALTASVARTYDLSDVAESHRAVMEDSFLGKLVVEP